MKHFKLLSICLTIIFVQNGYSQTIEKANVEKTKSRVEEIPEIKFKKIEETLNLENNKDKNTSYWRVYFVWIKDQNGQRTSEYYLFRPENEMKYSDVEKEVKRLYGHKKYVIRTYFLEQGDCACIYDGKSKGKDVYGYLGTYKNISETEARKRCEQSAMHNSGYNITIIKN